MKFSFVPFERHFVPFVLKFFLNTKDSKYNTKGLKDVMNYL